MFRPMAGLPPRDHLTIDVDGRPVVVRSGVSLAIALMEAGIVPIRRSPVSGAPRSPLCLMGVCFECLADVDGKQNVQSCMIEVADGMRVRLTMAAPQLGSVK